MLADPGFWPWVFIVGFMALLGWSLWPPANPDDSPSPAPVTTGPYSPVVSASGSRAVAVVGDGNIVDTGDKLIFGDPPLVLNADVMNWVLERVRAVYATGTDITVFGRGKSSPASDELASFLTSNGILNVQRSTSPYIISGAESNGPVAFSYNPTPGPVSVSPPPRISIIVDPDQ